MGLPGQDRRHRHQPVLAGAGRLLAGPPPLHRRAGDVPCSSRLDGADGAGELLPAPPGLHPRRSRLRPARPQARGPRGLKEMQTKELQHGRLAMLAAAGMIVQELQTGSTLFYVSPSAPASADNILELKAQESTVRG